MNTADRLAINERAHTAQTVVEQISRICPTCSRADPGICGSCAEYPERMHCRCRHTRSRLHEPMHDDRFNIIKTVPNDQPPEHDPATPWVVIWPRIHGQTRQVFRCHSYHHAILYVTFIIAIETTQP